MVPAGSPSSTWTSNGLARPGQADRCQAAGLRSHRRGQGFESPQLHQQKRFPCSRSQRRSPELQRASRGGGLLVGPEVTPRRPACSSRVLTATSMGGAAPGIGETPSSRKPWVARREVRTAGRAAGSCLRSLASAAGSTPASRSRWTSRRTACGCGRPAPIPTGRGSTRPARPAAGSPPAAQQGRGDRSHQAACNLAPSLATSACSRVGLKGRPKLVKLADSSTRPFPSRMASW
jgi:hypothetical protein